MCQKLIQMTKMEKCLNKQKAYGKYNSNNDKNRQGGYLVKFTIMENATAASSSQNKTMLKINKLTIF